MLGLEILIAMVSIIFGPGIIGEPQRVISDLDSSLPNATTATNQSGQNLQALLQDTLQNIQKLNQTMEQQGIDDGMIITKGFVLDPSDHVVGGIASAENFTGSEPQVINQTSSPIIINQSDND